LPFRNEFESSVTVLMVMFGNAGGKLDEKGTEQRRASDREDGLKKWRYDDIVRLMEDKEMFIQWLMDERLIAKDVCVQYVMNG